MAENPRPPVAIRIVRPYATEDELLEHELETIGKTSVLLLGAHSRPVGVILRFEVTLASGAVVLRGEGRVLAHKEKAFRGQSALTLRFTRLDPKSKAVVDRAAALRDARTRGDVGAANANANADANEKAKGEPSPRGGATRDASGERRGRKDAPIVAALTADTPPPPAMNEKAPAAPSSVEDAPTHVDTRANAEPSANEWSAHDSVPPTVEYPPLTQEPVTTTGGGDSPRGLPSASVTDTSLRKGGSRRGPDASAAARATPIEAPANRAELLDRLRARGASMPRERVEEILAARPSPPSA